MQSTSSGSERVSSRHFYFLLAPSPDGRDSSRPPIDVPSRALARLGLIVTRKLGGAVVRNRIKRICRECFRRLAQDERWVAAGTDVVVIARAGAEKLSMTDALAEWEKLRPVIRKRSLQALAKASNKGHLSPPGQRS
ncbi:ribonuclease P protein component [Pendulispora rubella]|uniref:Ribonuclease P protein component n=1 Tax=Pendulispora rubella TaxID=2741070 RepID=A0ABZ2LIL5_9BACT